MSSLLFIDIETTGLSDNAAVIELAAIPYIDGQYGDHFQIYIAPHEGASIDPKALDINGIDPKKLSTFTPPHEAVAQFIEWIDKHEKIFTIAAHNVAFDKKHLFALFCRTANYSNFITRFRFNDFCTFRESKAVFKNKRKRPDGFSLGKLCKYFQIELLQAHSALPDIVATTKLYEELKKLKIKELPVKRELTYQEKRHKYMSNSYLSLNADGDCFINTQAMKDPEAMRFILGELWDLTQEE